MFTKKSFLIGSALLLICALAIVTVVSSVTPSSAQTVGKSYNYKGVAAIPVLNEIGGLLSPLDIMHYLNTQGMIGGSTENGVAPKIQNITLTNITDLSTLKHITIPGLSGRQSVYYVLMNGPFHLSPNLPLSALNTLIPSTNNLPQMRNLPLLNNLPGLNSFLSSSQSMVPALGGSDPFSGPDSPLTVLQSVYEVFNANNGNLLAWG
jgi:hypothetical protein